MNVVFRCQGCETINDIPKTFKHRFCKKCGKIVTYSPGEAIVCRENDSECNEFLNARNLNTQLAQKFFTRADKDYSLISELLQDFRIETTQIPDVLATSFLDTVMYLLRINDSKTLDEFVVNCEILNLNINKVEKALLQMKSEGIIYNPKGWIIQLA